MNYKTLLFKLGTTECELDLSEDHAKLFGDQYEEGQVFFKGKWVDVLDINEIKIRETPRETTNYYPTLTSATIFFGTRTDVKTVTRRFIKSPPKKEKINRLIIDLMDAATFLELDNNWSLATCALQLQEVAVTLVAIRKNIKLSKTQVERILGKQIQELSFNRRYEAFTKYAKDSFHIDLPILTTYLRKMRTKVLHEGYNPKPEETESIVSFTIGLLNKLRKMS